MFTVEVRKAVQTLTGLGVTAVNMDRVLKTVLKLAGVKTQDSISSTSADNIAAEREPLMDIATAVEIVTGKHKNSLVNYSDGSSHHNQNMQVESMGFVNSKGKTVKRCFGLFNGPNHRTSTQVQGLTESFAQKKSSLAAVSDKMGISEDDMACLTPDSIDQIQGDHAGDVNLRRKLLDVRKRDIMLHGLGNAALAAMNEQARRAVVEAQYRLLHPCWKDMHQSDIDIAVNLDPEYYDLACASRGEGLFDAMADEEQTVLWRR
jgi:hypothetical protein